MDYRGRCTYGKHDIAMDNYWLIKEMGKSKLYKLITAVMAVFMLLLSACTYKPSDDNGKVDDPSQCVYYRNPVAGWRSSADPSVIRYEGVYYAYVTSAQSPIMKSVDLVNWEDTDTVIFPSGPPKWGDGYDKVGTRNEGVWAPDVVKLGDGFVFYYAHSVWGDENPGIGYATAPHPLGPWTHRGKLFRSLEIGVNNSIDPAVFTDQDGKVYMIWGSFRGLYGVELTADGMGLMGGIDAAKKNKVLIAGMDTEEPWNVGTYEAPYVIYRKGYYYLFVSTGLCCEGLSSTYEVKVSRSRNPLGPYTDDLGRDMRGTNRGYSVIRGSGKFVGTGHNSIATDDAGQDWLVYHAWENINGTSPYR